MSLILFQHPLIIDYAADLIVKANLEDEWDEFISSGQRSEDIFTRQLKIWFRQQSDDAINALHGNKILIRKYRSEEMVDFYRYQILFEEFEQMLFLGSDMYIEVTGKEIPADIKYIPKVGVIEKWGQTEMGRLGLGIRFDVLNPRVVEFARAYPFRFSWEITSETNQKLNALLVNAFESGQGIDKIEKRIRDMFDWMNKNRSRMIARTEVNRAANFGAEESYIQSGVVEAKIWWTARNERTCPFCNELHGHDMALGANYYDKGTVLTAIDSYGKKHTMRLNYEEIKRPPLHPNCYSDDTEIYTKYGWQYIKDVKQDEYVLSLNPLNKDLDWCKVIHTISRHADKMYHITNKQKSFDMLVTKDHPFFVYKRVDHATNGRHMEPKWIDDIDNLNSESQFYLSSRWFRLSPQVININGVDFNTQQFCKFMGYYLSEGSVVRRKRKKEKYDWYEIVISQSHYLQEMWDDLQGLPVRKMYLGKDKIFIKDEGLGDYLNQFGKSYEKSVPDVIKELSPYDIQIFLNAFRMGDGSIKKSKAWKDGNFEDSITYTTSSKRLADDLGELIIKTGKSVRYRLNDTKGKEAKFRNGTYFINHDTWTVSELTSQYRLFNKMQIKEIDYNKEVYDLEVEKHHTILTRRNGRVVWGSNCRCRIIGKVTI